MTFCLYECLRAVGLQLHYARFTSAGVCRAADLSELTIEDYPQLGICTMDERSRLFQLIQLIKSLDLDILGLDEDDSYNSNAAAVQDVESYAMGMREFNYNGSGSPDDHGDDDENPSWDRRRLDFSINSTDCHQKLSSGPVGSVHVNASHDSSTQEILGKASAMPVQLPQGNPEICNCKRNKFRSEVCSFSSDHHLEENFNPGITRGISMHNSGNILQSRYTVFQNPKPSSTTDPSKTSKNKTFGPQNRNKISTKQSLRPHMKRSGSYGCTAKQTPVFEAKKASSYNYGLPLNAPATPNKRRVGEHHRIMVCVRKRPLTSAENRRREADVVATPSGECVVVHEKKDAVDLSQYILKHKFYFDHVFGEGHSNEDVYQNTAYPLVRHMLNGGNATCLAYGQTGAGKTHTMLGLPPGGPGLYALAVRDIFMHLSTTHRRPSMQVFVSFFEIYCGQLYDLLDHRKRLFAREDGQKVVHISGLCHVRVDSVNSLLEVISHGMETRSQGMSGVNPCSSRSHALLQIQLKNSNQQTAGRLWFVDLAGSEKASETKEPDKQNRMEGAEINQSLLALKECIRALDREQSHTPFRQSKLTQVLKNAFIGDSMTCMIANISPGDGATEHTLNTLRYADRVKELKGQGGLRARRGSKAMPFPKHNLSNKSSIRGGAVSPEKSRPEKPNLIRQKDDLGSTTHSTRSLQRVSILCSIPKNSRRGKDANVINREEIRLADETPNKMWMDVGEKSNPNVGGNEKSRKAQNRRLSCDTVSEQSFNKGPTLGQQIDKQLDLWIQKEKAALQSEVDHSQKANHQSNVKEESGENRKWTEQRQNVESSRDIYSRAEEEPKRHFWDCSEEERKRHLRNYHEDLQKFILSTSSPFHLESPSTLNSVSSSVPVSSVHHSSSLSVSTNGRNGMEEYFETYAARDGNRVEGSGRQLIGEAHSENEVSGIQHSNHDVDVNDVAEDCWVFQKQAQVKCQKRLEVVAGDGRVMKRSAGTKTQQRRLAWGATQDKEPLNGMTILTNVKAQASDSYDAQGRKEFAVERLGSSDSPADGVFITEQDGAAGSYSGMFGHTLESPPQHAPAERPLSPAHGQTNTIPTSGKLNDPHLEFNNAKYSANYVFLTPQNSSEPEPSNRRSDDIKPRFAANKLSKTPTHTKKPETTVLPQNADSFSCIMDPLSISLLEVEQQLATSSYLQGDKSNGSLFRLEDESRGNGMRDVGKNCLTCAEMVETTAEYEDEEFRLSLLELPQTKPHIPSTSDFRAGAVQTERFKVCTPGDIESLKVSQDSLQSQTAPAPGSQDLASSRKYFTCTSLQTPVMQHAEQHFVDNSSFSGHEAITNTSDGPSESPHNVLKEPLSFMSTPENVSSQINTVPNQCHTIPLGHDTHENTSLQPNKTGVFLGKEDRSHHKTGPAVHLSTLDDLKPARCCIFEAHWEQLKEMEVLCHKERMLLHQQPDMAFGEYVHKLEEIMEKKAQCVHRMRAQLQPYLKSIHYSHFQQEEHK